MAKSAKNQASMVDVTSTSCSAREDGDLHNDDNKSPESGVDMEGPVDESRNQQQQQTAALSNIMESIVKITLAGLGGAIVGLSIEKRLSDMRVTTPQAMTAEARRKGNVRTV